VKLYVSSK